MAAIVQGGLTRIVVRRIGEGKTALLGMTVSALSYVAYGLAWEGWMAYSIIVVASMGGLTGPALQGLISRGVGPHEQGGVQGSLTSLVSVAGICGPILASRLFGYFIGDSAPVHLPGAAFFFSSALVVVAMGMGLRFFTQKSAAPSRSKPEMGCLTRQ
jgi:MFS transporter, DHA1 family, tetracycline resistance protein